MVFISEPHCSLLFFMLSSVHRKQTVNLKTVLGRGFCFISNNIATENPVWDDIIQEINSKSECIKKHVSWSK